MTKLRGPAPAALPAGRLPPSLRLRVLAEIAAAYVPLLRELRGNDLPAMVASARTVDGSRTVPAPADPRETAARLGWMVNRSLTLVPTDGRCLIQSLVLTRMLAARSIDSRVVLGVSLEDSFRAHAWVEHGDAPVLPAGRYERLMEL